MKSTILLEGANGPPQTTSSSAANEHDDMPTSELTALTTNAPGADAQWRQLRLVDRSLISSPYPDRHAAVAIRDEAASGDFFHLFSALERLAPDQRVIGVTSAVVGEGKTTIAHHLAVSVARSSYRRVCLVDLSLGEDELCRRVGVAPAPCGLVDLFESDRSFAGLVWPGPELLTLLPAGRAPNNPARIARSPRVADLIAALRAEFDLVIIDLPAVATDNASALASQTDGVVMVVRAGATPRDVVRAAVETLGRHRVIGLVLNRTTSARRGLIRFNWGRR